MADKTKLINTPNGKESSSKHYGTFNSHNSIEKQEEQPQKPFCRRRNTLAISIILTLIAITITTTLAIGIPSIQEKTRHFTQLYKSKDHTFKKAAIASDDPRCSQIGRKIMKKDGSAVDAAIGTLLCLEVVNPHHSGIGGGFFMTLYDSKTGRSAVVDAREYAPANIPLNLTLPSRNVMAIGVPLTLDGYWKIHQRFGYLKWSELFKPVIELCKRGYKVGATLADAIELNKDNIMKEPSLREIFVNKDTGKLLKKNDVLKRPIHAKTLETIAKEGISTFYNGSFAKSLVTEVQERGGVLTLEDLANAKASLKNPLNISLSMQDLTILTVPPPSSGSVMAFMLNILGQFNISNNEATNYQRLVETFKFGFAQRTFIGDEAFVDTKEAVANQSSIEFAKSISRRIVDNATFAPEYYNPQEKTLQDSGTSHVSVVDTNGLVVAVTSTVNDRFGALFRSQSLDVILNDEMNDFSDANSVTNAIKPGKKPLSSMIPSIFLDKNGEVVLVIGGAGGTRILTAVTMASWNYLHKMMTISESIAEPRIHHQLFPNTLEVENSVPEDIISALKSFGHNVKVSSDTFGHLNSIARDKNGNWIAVSESRMDSGVAGI